MMACLESGEWCSVTWASCPCERFTHGQDARVTGAAVTARSRTIRSWRGGFTLLEIVIAMGMAAMLLATLYTGLFVAQRAKRSAAAAVEPARAASIAAEMVVQDLHGVLPPTGIFRGQFLGERIPGERGNADALEFYCIGQDPGVTDMAMGSGADAGAMIGAVNEMPLAEGIRKVALVLRTDVTPPVLVRQVTRNLLAPTAPVPEEEVICRNVRSFSVQYFDGYSWVNDWDSTTTDNVLPVAVSIRIEMEDPKAVAGGVEPKPLVITRLVPLACARPLEEPLFGGVQ
jgi:hypothetical protein